MLSLVFSQVTPTFFSGLTYWPDIVWGWSLEDCQCSQSLSGLTYWSDVTWGWSLEDCQCSHILLWPNLLVRRYLGLESGGLPVFPHPSLA